MTSIRREGGRLLPFLFNTGVKEIRAGGPVLDSHGQVVGLMLYGIEQSTINYVVPAVHIVEFLRRPEITFVPPSLRQPDLDKPASFEARVEAFAGSGEPLSADLEVQFGDFAPARHEMKLADGVYRASVVPMPLRDGMPAVRIHVNYGDDSVDGSAADCVFHIGAREVHLREIRTLRFEPPRAVLNDGKALEGSITGLGKVLVQTGPERFNWDLSRARELCVLSSEEMGALRCSVVVRRDSKEIARVTRKVEISQSPNPSEPGEPAPKPISPAQLGGDKVTRQLPSVVTDAALGGGGRYVFLSLPAERKIAVFDVSQAAIVRYLDVPTDNFKIAAGMDKLLVGLPANLVIQRWSLTTFERELSLRLPAQNEMKQFLMGSASNGPLLTARSIFDIDKFKPLVFSSDPPVYFPNDDQTPVRVSANGKVFAWWNPEGSPMGMRVVALQGSRLVQSSRHATAGYICPSPDGRLLLTALGVFSADCNAIAGNPATYTIPAAHGPYYLDVAAPENGLTLYVAGDQRAIAHLPPIELRVEKGQPLPRVTGQGFSVDKRIYFVPDAKVIITIPFSNDRIVVYRADIEMALQKSGIDYLYVHSQPPASVGRETSFIYPVRVASKRGGVKFRLQAGPPGMTVSDKGRITWDVPARPMKNEANVVLAVSDASGQEISHSFTVAIRD